MNWKSEWKILLTMVGVFFLSFFLPVESVRFQNAVSESFYMLKEYAQLHVVFCLLPALFIAGAISVFVSQASVIKYLGANANKITAYSVAAVSGTILAVCSCTILPLFSGIYKRGAGLGPATAFLYSGPAINVLAIILTARVLGVEMGIARAVGAISFSVIIGLIMAFVFRHEEKEKSKKQMMLPEPEITRPLWHEIIYFGIMVLILVFANWAKPAIDNGLWSFIYNSKWVITSVLGIAYGFALNRFFKMKIWKILVTAVAVLIAYFVSYNTMISFAAGVIGLSYFTSTDEGELKDWFDSTWGFTKQILPLLFFGVLIAGSFLGRPGHEGLIPSEWIETLVGGNSLGANFFASVSGALMYFATLTEVPILQGLMGNGMGKGPALALLLSGPALSLPNMLVIRSVMGTKKTVVFVSAVVVMSTITGLIYGQLF
ncbi:MAG: permease [Candidatus Delongbacteria bacterium]|nr:permease [Candidatus Delongbacteria bacterium]MCG2760431.1 permease [Candidatus Delongbacteria bacterium]